MATVAQAPRRAGSARGDADAAHLPSERAQIDSSVSVASRAAEDEQDKALPLPGWLVKLYFIFPIVLYVPDAIFNYFVYSDGLRTPDQNLAVQIGSSILWGFVSIGVVGMAYLLSVLAPWHWRQGHRFQAFFCAFGVIIATAITTWNSLSYRSSTPFSSFTTDKWVYSVFPQLQNNNVSITMVLVAIAPPFWGLFWAVVQPTDTRRSQRQMQESHEERMMRMQQDAELKRLKAETNAKIREAQLRGMASTAAAARKQATELLRSNNQGGAEDGAEQDAGDETLADVAQERANAAERDAAPVAAGDASAVMQLPTYAPNVQRELANARGGASLMNHAAAAGGPGVYAAPATGNRAMIGQPQLLSDAESHGAAGDGVSFTPRRPATLLSGALSADVADGDNPNTISGQRPALRRPTEVGALMRGMNEPRVAPEHRQAVLDATRELSATGSKKTVSVREVTQRVAEKLNIDEGTAKSLVMQVREQQRTTRA